MSKFLSIAPFICVAQDMGQLLLTLGDIPHHGPVLLAWVLLRHTLRPDESSPVIRRIGNTALQLGVFQYLSTMLKGLGVSGNNVRNANMIFFRRRSKCTDQSQPL